MADVSFYVDQKDTLWSGKSPTPRRLEVLFYFSNLRGAPELRVGFLKVLKTVFSRSCLKTRNTPRNLVEQTLLGRGKIKFGGF